MHIKGLESVKKLYFIGIGGISMSALAKFFANQGYQVSGSDICDGELIRDLHVYGVKTCIGNNPQRKELREADCVIYTDAISEKDGEFLQARHMGKLVLSRPELLNIVCNSFAQVLSIAGSHGKTTCTSMCAHALRACNVPFASHIGGLDLELGNFYSTGDEYFVTEACEYKKNLLKIPANVAILLNIDKDHMECYRGEKDLVGTFREYCKNATTALVCADSAPCKTFSGFSTFAIKNPLADYRAVNIRGYNEKYSFTVEEYGRQICRLKLNCVGYCNIYNALAAFGAMRCLGFNENEIGHGIENFSGVKRRFEKIGSNHGVNFICDYAHHPKEICSTVTTARKMCRGELYVIFQPHTYSRTKLLMRDFVLVLQEISNLIIYKTYSARESYDVVGGAQTLAKAVRNCQYVENICDLKDFLLKTVKTKDTVLFLGAGDIDYIAKDILKELTE